MVHFVLGDSSIPATKVQLKVFANRVRTANGDLVVARHFGTVSADAFAGLDKIHLREIGNAQLRVDQNLERY